MRDKVKDITVEILISIRDEIKNLREDTNAIREEVKNLRDDTNAIREEVKNLRDDTNRRFEQMDKRFEHIEADIRAIVSYFERDYILLANKMGNIEGRLEAHISEVHH